MSSSIRIQKKLPVKKGRKLKKKVVLSKRRKKRTNLQFKKHTVSIGDTYENWLVKQQKQRKTSRPERMASETEKKLPLGSREEWLRKQKVTEKETKPEVTPAEDTYAEWLKRQVSERASKKEPVVETEETAEKAKEEQPPEPVELVA